MYFPLYFHGMSTFYVSLPARENEVTHLLVGVLQHHLLNSGSHLRSLAIQSFCVTKQDGTHADATKAHSILQTKYIINELNHFFL